MPTDMGKWVTEFSRINNSTCWYKRSILNFTHRLDGYETDKQFKCKHNKIHFKCVWIKYWHFCNFWVHACVCIWYLLMTCILYANLLCRHLFSVQFFPPSAVWNHKNWYAFDLLSLTYLDDGYCGSNGNIFILV